MTRSTVLFALSASVCLALRDIFGRLAMRSVDPIVGTAGSALLGLPILVVISLLLGDLQNPWPPVGPLLVIAIAGILRITTARTMLFSAIKRIGAARASPLGTTSTLFAMILGILFLGEVLTSLLALGSALVIGGSFLLARSPVKKASGEPMADYFMGVTIVMMSALVFGASTVLARSAVRFFSSPNQANLFANSAAVLSYAPVLWGRPWRNELKKWSTKTWAWVALSGSVASLGVTFSYFALAQAPVVFVAPITQTRPLFVVAISWIFFQTHENVTWRVSMGALTIVLGTGLLILGR